MCLRTSQVTSTGISRTQLSEVERLQIDADFDICLCSLPILAISSSYQCHDFVLSSKAPYIVSTSVNKLPPANEEYEQEVTWGKRYLLCNVLNR